MATDTPYDNIFQPRLHLPGSLCATGCVHCSLCQLGPQTYLTYRYESSSSAPLSVHQLSNGYCPRCAAL